MLASGMLAQFWRLRPSSAACFFVTCGAAPLRRSHDPAWSARTDWRRLHGIACACAAVERPAEPGLRGVFGSKVAGTLVGAGLRVDGIDPDGEPYSVSGCYLEIVRNQRIVATWDYDGAVAALKGPTSRIQIDLRARGEDACELTLAHSELANTEAAERY